MASLKAVKERMRSVDGIRKITSAMKMVSAAKFRSDEKRMINGIPFSLPATKFMNKIPEGTPASTTTVLALASDKGLCGAINSIISKETKNILIEEEKKGNSVQIVGVGNKVASGLKRLYGDRFSVSFEEVQKTTFNFTMASLIAERLIKLDPERMDMVHNEFRTMMSYDTNRHHMYTKKEIETVDKAEYSKAIDQYEYEGESVEDLQEFYYASSIFGSYLNGIAAEQSARMAAMENATKNCGEIIDKLALAYNRARQAKITTELCEIISGASAV